MPSVDQTRKRLHAQNNIVPSTWVVGVGMLSRGQMNATFDPTFDPTLLHPMLRSFDHPVFSVTTPSNKLRQASNKMNMFILLVACCNMKRQITCFVCLATHRTLLSIFMLVTNVATEWPSERCWIDVGSNVASNVAFV